MARYTKHPQYELDIEAGMFIDDTTKRVGLGAIRLHSLNTMDQERIDGRMIIGETDTQHR